MITLPSIKLIRSPSAPGERPGKGLVLNLFLVVYPKVIPCENEIYYPVTFRTLFRVEIIHFLIRFPLMSALVTTYYILHRPSLLF